MIDQQSFVETVLIPQIPWESFCEIRGVLEAMLPTWETPEANEEQRAFAPVARRALAIKSAAEWQRFIVFALRMMVEATLPAMAKISRFEVS